METIRNDGFFVAYCIENEINLFQNCLKNISFALKFIF